MALSAPATWKSAPSTQTSFEVKNASVIWQGALCMFDTTSGRLRPYDGTISAVLAGWATGEPVQVGVNGKITGDASAPAGMTALRAAVAVGGDFTIRSAAVTGASAETDQGKPVYATDDGTFTLTDPTTHRVVVGYVTHYVSSGVCDFFTKFILGVAGS